MDVNQFQAQENTELSLYESGEKLLEDLYLHFKDPKMYST